MAKAATADTPRVNCATDGCTRHVADNKWAKIHSIGRYFMRDGSGLCPEHAPDWFGDHG